MDTGEYNNIFYSEIFGKSADKYYRIQRKKMEVVLSMTEMHENGKIVDIGCGDGLITELLKKTTKADAYGLDISKSAILEAKKRKIKATTIDVDREKLPFKKNTFDAVFCGDIIEHVYDTEKLLEDISRILKPNGYLIISVPNIASWYNRGFLLMGYMPVWIESSLKTYTGNPLVKNGMGHIHAFTKRSITELLHLKGFSIEIAEGSPVLADGSRNKWKETLWNGVDSFFAKKTTLASTIIIKARKKK